MAARKFTIVIRHCHGRLRISPEKAEQSTIQDIKCMISSLLKPTASPTNQILTRNGKVSDKSLSSDDTLSSLGIKHGDTLTLSTSSDRNEQKVEHPTNDCNDSNDSNPTKSDDDVQILQFRFKGQRRDLIGMSFANVLRYRSSSCLTILKKLNDRNGSIFAEGEHLKSNQRAFCQYVTTRSLLDHRQREKYKTVLQKLGLMTPSISFGGGWIYASPQNRYYLNETDICNDDKVGKWLLFCGSTFLSHSMECGIGNGGMRMTEVDYYWMLLTQAFASNQIHCLNLKVADKLPLSDRLQLGTDGRQPIIIYTQNYENHKNVLDVANQIRKVLGTKRVLKYKTDEATMKQKANGNGMRSCLYQHRWDEPMKLYSNHDDSVIYESR